ncbi:ABC transporter ATP-binding protein [Metabacillus litoralis]|uniref:ABC transporter ATP-binding protein n=1 Tax=Metabacillus litoralis TaxID=152268 RepID=UPI001CFE5AB8|nr:ABC transporter ATP-binding protein [Metabacillus litoralis]
MSEHLLSIPNLTIMVKERQQSTTLLESVNLHINSGEIVGLIGESGSGKSLTAKAIMNLLPGNMQLQHSEILFKNKDLLTLTPKNHRKLLGKNIGMIFQDYRSSFTPFIRIGKQMVETICAHLPIKKKEAKVIAMEVLEEMGLEADRAYHSYPFQLSGGQIQRCAIAMALALKPDLLICDEVTTALDVMSGEKVLDYLDFVRKETGCAVIMITHDLAQAYKRTDRMYVMHQGIIVEEGLPEQIRCHHKHPYTKKLCSCLLSLPHENELVEQRERVVIL